MRRAILLLLPLFFQSGLAGQTVSVGLIGGGALTDAVQNKNTEPLVVPGLGQSYLTGWSPHKDWIAGVMLDFRLRSRFSVEVDGIYRDLHARWALVEPNGMLNSVSPANVITWEIPVLAKYRFGGEGRVRPFLEAGPAFRTTGNLNFYPSHYGAAAGVGIETYWRGFRIAPTVRYTYWARDLAAVSDSPQSQRNQVELMVGVSRAPKVGGSPLGSRVAVGLVAGWGLTSEAGSSTGTHQVTYITESGTFPTMETDVTTGLRSPVVGPALEVSLARHFSVELDALHRTLRAQVSVTTTGPAPFAGSVVFISPAPTWEFPMLAKYRLRLGKVNPFVEGGPVFRLPAQQLSTHGVSAGGGVEMHWRWVHVAPTIRFSHWAENGPVVPRYAQNEAVLLLGVLFGGPEGATR